MAINTSLLITTNVFQDGILDKASGEPLAAGVISLYKDNNRTEYKNWYYQSGTAGNYTYIALANPLTLSAAGTVQDPSGNDVLPFFYPYAEDSPDNQEPYYITVYNSAATLQFTRENFPFVAPAGTTSQTPTFENLIVNNRFWRNIGQPDGNNQNSTTLTNETDIALCPNQHDGFSQPDFRFQKAVTGAAEVMTFKKFLLTATDLTNDITPEFYVNHQSTSSSDAQSRYYQFPVSLHLRTLEGQQATFTIQTQLVSGSGTELEIVLVKFTGSTSSGGTYTEVPFGSSLVIPTTSWAKTTITAAIPNASADTPTPAGDDAFYLRIKLPANAAFEVNFALPSLFIGNSAPTNDFKTYDQIDSVICTPRTGDYKHTLNSSQLAGYVKCNDGTIGARLSGATARANIDCWPLYKLIWESIGDNFAPVVGGRGANAYADWSNASPKPITLTKNLGRVLMGMAPDFTNTTFTVNVSALTFTVNTSTDELTVASHTFVTGDPVKVATTGTLPEPLLTTSTYYVMEISGTVIQLAYTLSDALAGVALNLKTAGTGTNSIVNTDYDVTVTSAIYIAGQPVQVSTTGALPGGLSANTVYYISAHGLTGAETTTIRLAGNITDAQNSRYIDFISAGSGTNTISNVLGATTGVGFTDQVIAHTHNYEEATNLQNQTGSTTGCFTALTTETTTPTGVNRVSNVTPATMVNVYLKL